MAGHAYLLFLSFQFGFTTLFSFPIDPCSPTARGKMQADFLHTILYSGLTFKIFFLPPALGSNL